LDEIHPICSSLSSAGYSALVECELIPADLFDSPCDPIPVQRAHGLQGLDDHQAEGTVEDVALVWRHVLEAYTSHVLTVNRSHGCGFASLARLPVGQHDATKPMLKWDTAWRALRDAAGLHGLRFHDLRHTVITERAEMGVTDHVLESISGHLSRRMLEHYSHIRIDAKRQALDALDAARRAAAGNGNVDGAKEAEIETVIDVPDELTSQSRHSLRLSGSPPSGKLLIPLEHHPHAHRTRVGDPGRRDVRVVEGARLEIDSAHAC
jgi:hypothetical protein